MRNSGSYWFTAVFAVHKVNKLCGDPRSLFNPDMTRWSFTSLHGYTEEMPAVGWYINKILGAAAIEG